MDIFYFFLNRSISRKPKKALKKKYFRSDQFWNKKYHHESLMDHMQWMENLFRNNERLVFIRKERKCK